MVDFHRVGKYCGEINLHTLILFLYSLLHIHDGPLLGTGYWAFIQYHLHLTQHNALHTYESISLIKTQPNKPTHQTCHCLKIQKTKMSLLLEKKHHFQNTQFTAAGEPCYIKRQINLLPSTSQSPKEAETRRNSFLDSKFGELYVPGPWPSSFSVQSQTLVGRTESFPVIGGAACKEGWKCVQSHRTKIHLPLAQAEKSTQKEHLVDPAKSSFQNTAKIHTATGK